MSDLKKGIDIKGKNSLEVFLVRYALCMGNFGYSSKTKRKMALCLILCTVADPNPFHFVQPDLFH